MFGNKPAGGFNFGGTPNTSGQQGGFNFGGGASGTAAPSTNTAAPGGFTFGTPGQPSTGQPAAGGFNFSNAGAATLPQKTLGNPLGASTPVVAATAAQPLATNTAAPATGGFSFGNAGAIAAPQGLAGLLGNKPQTTTKTTVAATPSTGTGLGFNFAQPVTSTTTGSLGGLLQKQATTATGLTTGTTAPVLGLNSTLGLNTAKTTAVTAPITAAPTLGLGAAVSATTTVTAAPAATTSQKSMNYQQLEDNINKWMSDLEKQEKDFLEQATQVNAWDRLLIENGEKITSLNNDMERVKIDQQKLDHELDFIKAQQQELEELLVPLEKSVDHQPTNFQQHADLERENTYQLAENVDAQLKRMVQDLKEIIDHLNKTNTNQDNTDPIQQITKILNSHMDSLQWIDQNSGLLARKVDDISKQMETQRKEQERNFRLVYN